MNQIPLLFVACLLTTVLGCYPAESESESALRTQSDDVAAPALNVQSDSIPPSVDAGMLADGLDRTQRINAATKPATDPSTLFESNPKRDPTK
ncbi:hypothetical protein CA13_09750 [Planctomycetes bacterium CA13]|uniref:Uncharacterized protein n=1 Tax=Novipirellula herctigrandis TaxID=2527986 RepID=A0A5C5YY54_9BACT|nr:hypothetical protein CA13_73750 [Planctomycetes bacterium CA13]TWT79571.1 hypothetical protein CA13_09750 [Planctomycetes bacterium CA13]